MRINKKMQKLIPDAIEKMRAAADCGAQAFSKGLYSAPYLNREFFNGTIEPLLEAGGEHSKFASKLMEIYSDSWHKSNVNSR